MKINNNQDKVSKLFGFFFFLSLILISINVAIGLAFVAGLIIFIILRSKNNLNTFSNYIKDIQLQSEGKESSSTEEMETVTENVINPLELPNKNYFDYVSINPARLEKRKKYLHIALNNSLGEALSIIQQLPSSDRILIEVGTPMIKQYGTVAIERVKKWVAPGTYIVADNKCADLASREVEMMAKAGANASTCLGVAPIETIDSFIEECQKYNIDSMIDMMNVEDSLSVLKKLKKLPNVVILHRGVDETEITKGKQIPLYQIKQIKGNYNIMVAVAGGDTIKEVQSALFNDADIVVVWKNFYQVSGDTALLANDFLKEIK